MATIKSIEEKAKAYDEALKIAKEAAEKGMVSHNFVSDIFPELRESEDERIRKHLIGVVELYYGNTDEQEKKDCLDWLERQGEQNQKHFELKAGHWYICHRAYCCRADHLTVKEGERFMCEKDGVVKGFVIKEPEKYFKEVCAPAPMEDEQKSAGKVEPKFKAGDKIISTISNIPYYITGVCNGYYITDVGCVIMFNAQENFKLFNQKYVWSEEDDYIIERLFCLLNDEQDNYPQLSSDFQEIEEIKNKLNSLKERYTWKPSDEQIDALEDAIADAVSSIQKNMLNSLYSDLKKLKEE